MDGLKVGKTIWMLHTDSDLCTYLIQMDYCCGVFSWVINKLNCTSGHQVSGNQIVVDICRSEMYFLSSHDTALVKLFLIVICAIATALESADLINLSSIL